MSPRIKVCIGPSNRKPIAATRTPDGSSFLVLFDDGTVAVERDESNVASGYEMIYRSVEELQQNPTQRISEDRKLKLTNTQIFSLFVLPAMLFWLSVRTNTSIGMPESPLFLLLILLAPPIISYVLIAKVTGRAEIIIFLRSEEDPIVLEMVSPTYLTLQYATAYSFLLLLFSTLYILELVNIGLSVEIVILVLLSIKAFVPRIPTGGGPSVELLSCTGFYTKLIETVEHVRETNRDPLSKLLKMNESVNLEFKLSMWTKYITVNKIATNEFVKEIGKSDFLQDEILHTVAAFLNTEGGTLLIGVKDKPPSWGDRPAEVYGVEPDYRYLQKNNRDADGYVQAVYQVLNTGFGNTSTTSSYVKVRIEKYEENEICRIDVKKLPRVRDAQVYIKEKTDITQSKRYYVRTGSSSQKMSLDSALDHIRNNFPPPNIP